MSAGFFPAGIVLAGGRSARMGTDKAALVVDGMRMIDRVIAALRAAEVGRVVIAGGEPGLVPGVETVPDAAGGNEGPMAGIATGWRALRADGPDPVVVVSCDLPRLDSSTVWGLVRASAGHAHGAAAHDGRSLQPLVAAYRPRSLELVDAAFEAGERSIRRLFRGWDLASVPVEPSLVTDADDPGDLAGLAVEWPDEPGPGAFPQ